MCDRYDVLLVADEVITAFGRTGRWFAVEHDGALPDVITFGKGIGGGVDPALGDGRVAPAARGRRRLAERLLRTATRSRAYPLGCAVGCAVIDTIEDEGLVEAAPPTRGARLREPARADAPRATR